MKVHFRFRRAHLQELIAELNAKDVQCESVEVGLGPLLFHKGERLLWFVVFGSGDQRSPLVRAIDVDLL